MGSAKCIGTVISDGETPSFETVRIKLKVGQDIKPGALIRLETTRDDAGVLIGRVRSACEVNPNENPIDINVRDGLKLPANYPKEIDSTTIYRIAEADLIEEMVTVEKILNGERQQVEEFRAPQTLPNSGAEVYRAGAEEIVKTLGLATDDADALVIGETVGGTRTAIKLSRSSIQRHFFICGTTGSGKSYAVGVLAEELIRHGLPVIFIDTQDEYAPLVRALGGTEVTPGRESPFSIRISALTEDELLDLMPRALQESSLQSDIVGKAFANLKARMLADGTGGFDIDDLLAEIATVAPQFCAKPGDVPRTVDTVQRRVGNLERFGIFGPGVADWPALMTPCLSIRCQRLYTMQLQSVATAVLRELQNLRLAGKIPPYTAVIDEAHLFVPEGQESACKQIIREGVRIGRHHGISMVLLTQSPVDIDKRAIRQCNTRLVFALEPDQLDAIKGVKSDASEEMLRALPKMPRGHCLVSGTYESIKHAVAVKIRLRQTRNSEGGQTPDIFAELASRWSRQS